MSFYEELAKCKIIMIKKTLIGVGIFLVVILVALATAPIIFKDEIKKTIDEQLAANVDADVLYDIDNFSVSFFSNFPNLTAGITDLGIVGREPFAGETLFKVSEFAIELNIWKLLGSEMSIQGIYLDQPHIFIKVLDDGRANYDIAMSSDVATDTLSTEAADFQFAIESWRITNGHFIYDDATLPTYVELTNFNHSGSGNFTLSVFDLRTRTQAYINSLSYDGAHYLERRDVDLDLLLNMDLDQMKFTFKENTMAINEFVFGFDGWLAMPAEDITMDLTFNSQDNSFKSLISLIPAIYTEDFEELETSGSLAFDGALKGTYNDVSMPAYDINLKVNDGMFHYPELPESLQNVQVDMNIASSDGNVDNTSINISKFHLEFGQEPLDGYFKLGNLVNFPIDLELNTTINLANLNKLLPINGLDMEGIIEARIRAEGEYDSINSTIPKIDAIVKFTDGAMHYADVPAPIDQINMTASLQNTTGILNDTKFTIPEFSMALDESPISGQLVLENFDNLHWQTALSGDLNFNKLFPIINHLYPMPGTTIRGNISTSLSSQGTMQDVDNENYQALETSGEAVFTGFVYMDSTYLPQGLELSSGKLSFDPKQIIVSDLIMQMGASDFTFNGSLSNYIDYVFNDDVIFGKLDMTSRLINVDEFMSETTTAEPIEEETEYTVVEVPKNINFLFKAQIDEIRYDNLVLEEAKGQIKVRDGELHLDDLFTKTLGGTITFDGLYSTSDLSKPEYAMSLDVKAVEIAQTYKAFNMVKAMAPIAKDVSGQVSSLFKMNGLLKVDMMPDMKTLNGKGVIRIVDASLRESKFANGLTNFIKAGENQALSLKDIIMNVEVADGRLKVEPFDVQMNNTTANIGGISGLDGSLDYNVKLAVPAGQLGSQVNSLLGSLTGQENTSETIKLNIGLGGTYDDPAFKLLGTDGQGAMQKAATQKATDILKENTGVDLPTSREELNAEAIAQARVEAEKLLSEAQKRADQVKLESKRNADKLRAEAKTQNDKLLAEAGSNVLKKTAAQVAGKKLIEEADVQAARLEAEGEKQAAAIIATAQTKADAIIKKAEK